MNDAWYMRTDIWLSYQCHTCIFTCLYVMFVYSKRCCHGNINAVKSNQSMKGLQRKKTLLRYFVYVHGNSIHAYIISLPLIWNLVSFHKYDNEQNIILSGFLVWRMSHTKWRKCISSKSNKSLKEVSPSTVETQALFCFNWYEICHAACC